MINGINCIKSYIKATNHRLFKLLLILVGLGFMLLVKLAATAQPSTEIVEKNCVGKYKIPLDENLVKVVDQTLEIFQYENFDTEPLTLNMRNDGITLRLDFNYTDNKKPIIFNGPLADIGNFTPYLIYWHWLERADPKYDFGNITFPAEMHLASYNTKYSSFSESIGKKHGIIIFAYAMQVVNTTCYFDTITHILDQAYRANYTGQLPGKYLSLDYFQYLDHGEFYTYHGSMASVNCYEDIIWFDFLNAFNVNLDFVKRLLFYQDEDNVLLHQKVQQHEPPKGPVIKSIPPEVDEEEEVLHSSTLIADVLNGATATGRAIFVVILGIMVVLY